MLTDLIRGVPVRSGVVVLTPAQVGIANAAPIFLISNTGAAVGIGTKSFKLKKLMVRNNNGGDCWLFLGTGAGAGFAAAIPPVRVVNMLDAEWEEMELPAAEVFANLTGYLDALAAGQTLDVQVEGEEIG